MDYFAALDVDSGTLQEVTFTALSGKQDTTTLWDLKGL